MGASCALVPYRSGRVLKGLLALAFGIVAAAGALHLLSAWDVMAYWRAASGVESVLALLAVTGVSVLKLTLGIAIGVQFLLFCLGGARLLESGIDPGSETDDPVSDEFVDSSHVQHH